MPIDYSHQHLSSSVMEEGSPHTPISTGGADGVTVDNGTDPPVAVTTLVAIGADVATEGEARVQGINAHNGVEVAFGDTGGTNCALRVGYDGVPTDYIPLVEIGDGPVGRKVFAIDSSGDADHTFRDAGVSLQYHVDYAGQPGGSAWVLLKISEDGLIVASPGTVPMFEIYPGDGSIFMHGLPTLDPGVAGQLWSSSNTLKISAG